MTKSYIDVTELSGDQISSEQLLRMHHRYVWASRYCNNKNVIELACGAGQGLGLLANVAYNLHAGDIDPQILSIAKNHYGDRIPLDIIDATNLPFSNNSVDVLILFEAIYYISDVGLFISECSRVLKSGGQVLIASANKDLSDFNPSPNSFNYFGANELYKLFSDNNYSCKIFGYLSTNDTSIMQKLLKPVKLFAVKFDLIPKTMKFKKFFKRIVFGKLVTMPSELFGNEFSYVPPNVINPDIPDISHKVIYLEAKIVK